MDYLIDTNVLLRALAVRNPLRPVARQTIKALLQKGAGLCVAPQNLVELWNVCTRPEKYNGLGKTIAATDRYLRFIESFAAVLPETPDLFIKWRELVVTYEVSGAKVHDARLVAAMTLHHVSRILTFNTQDFARFRNIEAINPAAMR
ncbi:MAG: PIN domain-containing protein [Terriglobia bacterium]|jgi:predicted nucleic acid-binding protein